MNLRTHTRRSCLFFLTLISTVGFNFFSRLAAETKRDDHELIIRPMKPDDWHASLKDVEKVLLSAANELWKNFPERSLPAIEVEPQGGPITHYRRGVNGEYHVQLDTKGNLWAQYSYQFSHEFCHILCNYRMSGRSNKWFEETLCELASIYTLRAMAKTWEKTPPYANWKDYSKSLKSYADDVMKKGQLPEGKTLAQWFAENRAQLAKDPVQRDLNRIVAVAILDLVEESPDHWQAVQYLNLGDTGTDRSIEVHMNDWEAQCPSKHKVFVRQIKKRLGIE